MTTSPTPDTRPCFGVGDCPKHAVCARYAAIETNTSDDRVATCIDQHGSFPGFVELGPVERVKEQAA